MSRPQHDIFLRLMVALILVCIVAVVAYNDYESELAKMGSAMRKIDPVLIDLQVRDGNLSNTPARHWKALE